MLSGRKTEIEIQEVRKLRGMQCGTLHLKRKVSEIFFFKSPVLKVPRHCSFVLLVEVCARNSKGLGKERYEA